MSLRIAFQMDPLSEVDINADTTFRLIEEAQKRGHSNYVYSPESLKFDQGVVKASGSLVKVDRDADTVVCLEDQTELLLNSFDIIWLRQDPPFDMLYITTTHILDLISSNVLVVNNPFWVRNFPEKLLVLQFPKLIPPTLISRDLDAMKKFHSDIGEMIVKPLYGNGGEGIFKLSRGDPNLSVIFELFIKNSREPLICQKYLPQVKNGDKRIILIDGEPVGAINRVPKLGEVRSNMHVGGTPEKSTISKSDLEICKEIGPTLKDNGQFLVGIDVIGNNLTEINLTSPTGIQEIERFDGVNMAGTMWKLLEKKVASGKKN